MSDVKGAGNTTTSLPAGSDQKDRSREQQSRERINGVKDAIRRLQSNSATIKQKEQLSTRKNSLASLLEIHKKKYGEDLSQPSSKQVQNTESKELDRGYNERNIPELPENCS